ncbi:Hypothetical protein A7982_05579 [Minicystis rosea]|nr:Hypothetical protein A7982_05579 [Minicystis rosea]
MPAPTQTDIERLLAPISAEAPAGESLRHEGTYEKLREARREDDASIPQGVWTRPLKVADWNAVVSLSNEALERRTKDLQIAAWLAEAWAHLHGVAGTMRGLELVAGMLDRFWETLFPELDDGDDEPRARLVDWLDEALSRRLRLAKMGDDRTSITFGEWERAGSGENAEDPSAPTREGLLARMSLVGSSRWAAVHAEIRAALAAVKTIGDVIDTHMKGARPPRRTEDTLRAMQALAADVLEATGGRVEAEGSTAVGSDGDRTTDGTGIQGGTAPVATGGSFGGPITSRAEAYQRLVEASDFLLRTEPHSPVPYLVKRAISWGNMPLTQLLQEFISGADDLVTTHRLLGMRQREE